MHVCKMTCVKVQSSVICATDEKFSKCPLTGQWQFKMWYICDMMKYYLTIEHDEIKMHSTTRHSTKLDSQDNMLSSKYPWNTNIQISKVDHRFTGSEHENFCKCRWEICMELFYSCTMIMVEHKSVWLKVTHIHTIKQYWCDSV